MIGLKKQYRQTGDLWPDLSQLSNHRQASNPLNRHASDRIVRPTTNPRHASDFAIVTPTTRHRQSSDLNRPQAQAFCASPPP
jgi:hypothetical protein